VAVALLQRGQLAVGPSSHSNEPILERIGQVTDVAAVANLGHVLVGSGIRVAGRRRLIRTDDSGEQRCWK